MKNQNPQQYKDLLLPQIKSVEESLFAEFPNNGVVDHLETGTRYNGNGKVDAYLSFDPQTASSKESIDLTLSLSCTERGAIFASKILWSSGRTIDEVVVCEICPECEDELDKRVDKLMEQNRQPIVNRMVELLDNFYNSPE